MGDKYRVLVGINYPPDDKRAEVGDVVDDLPDFAIKKLLAANVVEKYVEETPAAPVKEPAAAESTPQEPEPVAEAPAGTEAPAAENTPAELADGLKQVQDAAEPGKDGIDVLRAAAAPEEPAQEPDATDAQPAPAEAPTEPTAPEEAVPEAPAEGASK